VTHEPYHPAEALSQALTRAEAAEQECRALRIELENVGNSRSRLGAELYDAQREIRQLGIELEHAGDHCVQAAAQLRELQNQNEQLAFENLRFRENAREARAG
jgi:chromosome segregation ATPase